MTVILAIDPGPQKSAWLVYADRPLWFGIVSNEQLIAELRKPIGPHEIPVLADVVAIEQIEPRYGTQMGWETLATARWVGRFEEAARWMPVYRLKRSEVLSHLQVVTRGPNRTTADAGVRQALIDRFGGIGGKAAAIGLKASPGPLYGLKADLWAALAVAVTWADQQAAE